MRELTVPDSTQTIPGRAKELASNLTELRKQRESEIAQSQGKSLREMKAERHKRYLASKAEELQLPQGQAAKELMKKMRKSRGKHCVSSDMITKKAHGLILQKKQVSPCLNL